MKVVLATDALTPGGVGRHMKDLAEGLAVRGFQVGFAAPTGSSISKLAASMGARFTPFEDGIESADVWHLHLADTYHRQSMKMLIEARLRCHRVVVTEHLPRSNASDPALTDDRRSTGAHVAKTVFKRLQLGPAHSVIAVSHGSRRFLIDRYGLRPTRVIAIQNGVDLAQFSDDGHPVPDRSTRTVLAAGSLIRQKGHDVLIRAAALSRHDWSVAIAGIGPQQTALAALADEIAPGRVHFHGWADDVRSLILGAAVACMPSRWESFAYFPLEAMALGRPLVTSRVDGVDEYLIHEQNGLRVEPNDPAALSAAIDSLFDDPQFAADIAQAGRRVAERFNVGPMIDQTCSHYRSLL